MAFNNTNMASIKSGKVYPKRRQRADESLIDDATRILKVDEDTSSPTEDKEEDDGPVVFFCGKCYLPVGDSLSWAGSDHENQIHLKRVTGNVLVGEEQRLYETKKKHRCLINDLSCKGCQSLLGMVYLSTPKALDYKRFTFSFLVQQLESYVLGSADQEVAAENLPVLPLTVEDRDVVQQQLLEMKTLVVSMAQRLEQIEGGLQLDPDETLQ